MSHDVFTDEFLNGMRQRGDPIADETVEAVVERYAPSQLLDVLQGLVRIPPGPDRSSLYDRLNIDPSLRERLETFFRESTVLPEWADARLIAEGKSVFQQQLFFNFVTLGCASLPACYCWSPEATILGITGRLERDVPRRLPETAQMVVDVMAKESLFWEGGAAGPGLRALIKVRLMHAAIRQLVLRRHEIGPALVVEPSVGTGGLDAMREEKFFARFVVPETEQSDGAVAPWDVARDGVPVNQEQLAATLLTFSYVTIEALARFGVRLSDAHRRAFMHRWNVIGHVLGVDETITTRLERVSDAAALFERAMARNRRRTVDGPELAAALLRYFESNIARRAPVFSRLGGQRVPRILMRDLSGEQTAAVLDVQLANGDRLLRYPLWLLLLVFGAMKNLWGLKVLSEALFRWLSHRMWDWRAEAPERSEAATPREMGAGEIVLPQRLTVLHESRRGQS